MIKKSRAIIYIHGKGGNAAEAEQYKAIFPDDDVIGFDYRAATPWEARAEFPLFLRTVRAKYDEIVLIANSIGAYFAMHALAGEKIDRAFFISPVADMETLILSMMASAGVSESELREKKEIPTPFGEALSWDYLSYVRANPVSWRVPTDILYGGRDALVSRETVSDFARRTGATLTVMPGGEHWLHTKEQMQFLYDWLRARLS